jgi:hypothetical protein
MKSNKIVLILVFALGALFTSGYCQTREKSVTILNEHLKNTCPTFDGCEEIKAAGKYLRYVHCDRRTDIIPMIKVSITTMNGTNSITKDSVYYVEISCPGGNSCIMSSGGSSFSPAVALAFGFANDQDRSKALRIFRHLQALAKKERDDFDN